jgi:hypothetical protein
VFEGTKFEHARGEFSRFHGMREGSKQDCGDLPFIWTFPFDWSLTGRLIRQIEKKCLCEEYLGLVWNFMINDHIIIIHLLGLDPAGCVAAPNERPYRA